MKKLFTLFALMCLMVSGAWAEIVPTNADLSNPTKYVMTNKVGVSIGNDLRVYTEDGSLQRAQVAFIKQEGAENLYKIYVTNTGSTGVVGQYVALINNPVAVGKSQTTLDASEAKAEVFKIVPTKDGVSYLISPTSIPQTTYLNFYGGYGANLEGQTVGFWTDGEKDAGSCWILSAGGVTTRYCYINDGTGYLCNDYANPGVTSNNGTKDLNNRNIWSISTDNDGNVSYIINGQGKGYWDNSSEIKHFTKSDFESKNWTLEDVELPDEHYAWIPVKVRYADGMATYAYASSTQYIGDGGFFARNLFDFVDGQIDHNAVTDFIDADIEDFSRVKGEIIVSYYNQNMVDSTKILTAKIFDWMTRVGTVGYPTYETIQDERYFDDWYALFEATFRYDPEDPDNSDYPEYGFYYDTREAFAKLCGIMDVVKPIVGDAYRLAVREKSGNLHYLKEGSATSGDGAFTTVAEDASIFVLGTSNNTNYPYLLASNNNTQSHYLQFQGAGAEAYSGNYCELKFESMVGNNNNTNIVADYIQRVGTFAITTARRSASENRIGCLTYNATENKWDKSDAPLMKTQNSKDYTSAIELIPVDYPYNKVKMTSGSDRIKYDGSFASIYLPHPMTIPANVEVYEATEEKDCKIPANSKYTDYSGQTITFLRLNCIKEAGQKDYVPAGAYILYSQNDSESGFTALPAPQVVTDEIKGKCCGANAFVGSTENPEVYAHNDGWDDYPGDEVLWDAFKAKPENIGKTPYVLGNKTTTDGSTYTNKSIGFYEYRGDTYPKGKAIYMKDSTTPAKSLKLDFSGIVTAIEALHGNTTSAEIYDLQGRRLDKVQKGQINVINGQKVMFN